jgi:hypothetical protein
MFNHPNIVAVRAGSKLDIASNYQYERVAFIDHPHEPSDPGYDASVVASVRDYLEDRNDGIRYLIWTSPDGMPRDRLG